LSDLKKVEIYTDGACRGNPGPGGYGVVMIYGEKRRELSGGFRRTTNNRMEILGVIAGLETLLYPCEVTVTTDSKYVHDAMSKGWAKRWQKNGWRRHTGEPAVNPDLWERMLTLCATHKVRFEWVKGHAGHPENERCDVLSTTAARERDLPADEGYESARTAS